MNPAKCGGFDKLLIASKYLGKYCRRLGISISSSTGSNHVQDRVAPAFWFQPISDDPRPSTRQSGSANGGWRGCFQGGTSHPWPVCFFNPPGSSHRQGQEIMGTLLGLERTLVSLSACALRLPLFVKAGPVFRSKLKPPPQLGSEATWLENTFVDGPWPTLRSACDSTDLPLPPERLVLVVVARVMVTQRGYIDTRCPNNPMVRPHTSGVVVSKKKRKKKKKKEKDQVGQPCSIQKFWPLGIRDGAKTSDCDSWRATHA
jgi:hypothetical protein